MIYVRSRRPIVTAAGVAIGCALVFVALAAVALNLPAGAIAAVALGVGAGGALGVAAWAGWRLHRWPDGKLALFRDRLLVIHRRHEMRALWDRMLTVTLADPASWPSYRITDRVTITFRRESPVRFQPARFGLDAAACRDLIIRLRDDPQLRQKLPEFDSARDLASSPVVAGERSEPGF